MKNIPKIFQKADLILSGERSECTKTYMRTRIHDKVKNGSLKGERYNCYYLLLTLTLLISNVYADEITENNNILEKRVDISSMRKCDVNKEDAEYKCVCDLSIHYPIFTKQSTENGLKIINEFIEDFIKDQRNKMIHCQVGGMDFGKNTLAYNILYEDTQYLSIAFEKYFCCDAGGTKPDLFIFNFDITTGEQLDINKYLALENIPQLSTVIDKQLNKRLGKPETYKNMLLQTYKTDAGLLQVKLKNFAYFYFTKDGINIKAWPDKNSFETVNIQLPDKLIKRRAYLVAIPQDDLLNDSSIEIIPLYKGGDTE